MIEQLDLIATQHGQELLQIEIALASVSAGALALAAMVRRPNNILPRTPAEVPVETNSHGYSDLHAGAQSETD